MHTCTWALKLGTLDAQTQQDLNTQIMANALLSWFLLWHYFCQADLLKLKLLWGLNLSTFSFQWIRREIEAIWKSRHGINTGQNMHCGTHFTGNGMQYLKKCPWLTLNSSSSKCLIQNSHKSRSWLLCTLSCLLDFR